MNIIHLQIKVGGPEPTHHFYGSIAAMHAEHKAIIGAAKATIYAKGLPFENDRVKITKAPLIQSKRKQVKAKRHE